MNYVLNIADDGRIVCVSKQAFVPENAIIVEEIPNGNVTDYLYQDGKYIYSPIVVDNIEEVRADKLAEISQACSETITAGIDVETTQGIEHFSLEETDQINLNAALQAIGQGATSYPYHADKQLCRMFTAEEILAIVEAGTNYKVYHTTLCNHLLVWVRRAETVEEVKSITYSADNLPEDLATNMQTVLATASASV